jgi:hypothetical protein
VYPDSPEDDMSSNKPIQLAFDSAYLIHARSAVQDALTRTHGQDYARSFVQEYGDAIERAIRTRLHGRLGAIVELELAGRKS